MKKYYIAKNTNSKYHTDLLVYDDDTLVNTIELKSRTTDNYLRFPDNDLNIKYMNYDLVQHYLKDTDTFEVTKDNFKKKAVSETFANTETHKRPAQKAVTIADLEQFLEEGEKEMWFALKDAMMVRYNEAKAKEAKAAEIAKKKALIEQLIKEIEECEA